MLWWVLAWVCVPVMVFYPIFRKLYGLQSQGNCIPAYARDFSWSSPPKTNCAFQNPSEYSRAICWSPVCLALHHQLLTLSHLAVPSLLPSALTWSAWPFLHCTAPRPCTGMGKRQCCHGSHSCRVLFGCMHWLACWQPQKKKQHL